MTFGEKSINLIENNLLFLATSSKKIKPHVIVVACVKVLDNKILITDNFMKITKDNVLENKNVSLCVGSEKDGFLYMDGFVDYRSEGKEYDFIKSLKENNGLPCKGVLVVTVDVLNYEK